MFSTQGVSIMDSEYGQLIYRTWEKTRGRSKRPCALGAHVLLFTILSRLVRSDRPLVLGLRGPSRDSVAAMNRGTTAADQHHQNYMQQHNFPTHLRTPDRPVHSRYSIRHVRTGTNKARPHPPLKKPKEADRQPPETAAVRASALTNTISDARAARVEVSPTYMQTSLPRPSAQMPAIQPVFEDPKLGCSPGDRRRTGHGIRVAAAGRRAGGSSSPRPSSRARRRP